MKLIISIIHERDRKRVTDALLQSGHKFTNIATTGGFLRDGNTTLLIGCEQDVVDEIISVIRECCSTREQYVTQALPDVMVGSGPVNPIKVSIGGAIVFVVDVEKFERV